MITVISGRRYALALLCMTTALSLGACSSDNTPSSAPGTSISSQTGSADKSIQYGEKRESFATVERLYAANPDDAMIAARYAKVLRESGDIKKAKTVLDKITKPGAPSLAFTELAALNLETGNFSGAESAVRKAIKADDNNYRAWHILGISLDAQQKHPEAQTAFEKALSLWKGDAVPVMNNLALNLAAQGHTDKALAMLNEAKKKDPGRIEIERNIRIIRTLNEPAEYTPKPR
jgi:Flp pilus assembly protein TadD